MARTPDPAASSRAGRDAGRRAQVAQLKAQERRAERRRTTILVGTVGAVVLALVIGVTFAVRQAAADDPANKPVAALGVPTAQASCDAVVTDKVDGQGVHVGPGTGKPVDRVKYTTVPPTSGPHFVAPAPFGRTFYTARDRPPVEQLVHNLEHGYTVIWYDTTVKGGQLDTLQALAKRIPQERGKAKVVVTAWDDSYGSFPAGKHVAFSHWGARDGHRQLCGSVSGEAIEAFMNAYPSTDSPEPNAA